VFWGWQTGKRPLHNRFIHDGASTWLLTLALLPMMMQGLPLVWHASIKNTDTSVWKLNLVAKLIRGMTVEDAIKQVSTSHRVWCLVGCAGETVLGVVIAQCFLAYVNGIPVFEHTRASSNSALSSSPPPLFLFFSLRFSSSSSPSPSYSSSSSSSSSPSHLVILRVLLLLFLGKGATRIFLASS
jgi:hypothetical protein